MDVLFLWNIFRLYPGLEKSFERNSVRKNLFSSAYFCWDSRPFLREKDRKFPFGGYIDYCYSFLDSIICYSKIFRPHSVLHDAAGAVRSQTGKGPGCCYTIGRGPNFCLLGHVTGRLICFYVKIIVPSLFNSVDFWNSMSLIVLDLELTEKNIIQ